MANANFDVHFFPWRKAKYFFPPAITMFFYR
jgi:hypothetical protein